MTRWLGLWCLFGSLGGVSAWAQAPELPPEWEVSRDMAALAEQVRRFKPILDEVKPQDWVSQGAPEAYQTQWKSVTSEIEYLTRSTKELSSQPERLTVALETLFRMQSLDSILSSLDDGIRRYQNPALADLLRGETNQTAAHREKLRHYVVALAATKELEYKIMHEEAQRCRGMLSRQPAPKPDPSKPAEKK